MTTRYMSIYKTVDRGTPPTGEEMAAMGALIEEFTKSGVRPMHEMGDFD